MPSLPPAPRLSLLFTAACLPSMVAANCATSLAASSLAPMRLVPELAPTEVDLASRRYHDGHVRHEHLVAGVVRQLDPSSVGRPEIGDGHPPPGELHLRV